MKKNTHTIQKVFHCIRYDITEGILHLLPLFLLGIFFITMFSVDARMHLKAGISAPSALDIAIYVFQGIEEYMFVKGGPSFEIPITYLAFTLFFCLLACYYSHREWKLRGTVYIPRYQSKTTWWISKCIWCVMEILLFYILVFATIWIIAGIGGNFSFSLSPDAPGLYSGILLTTDTSEVFLYIYVLGAISAIALNQMQITLQMIFSPAVGYVFMIGIVTASAYFFNLFLMGNNFMLLRTALFREDGISLSTGIGLAFIVWLVFVIAGKVLIEKKDIL